MAFISQRWRSRARQQLRGPRRARWIADAEKAIDSRHIVPITPSLQRPDAIAALLAPRSPERLCWTLSENPNLDAKSEVLSRALHRIVGSGFVSFISCEPGKLAYFEGEGPGVRFILRRIDRPAKLGKVMLGPGGTSVAGLGRIATDPAIDMSLRCGAVWKLGRLRDPAARLPLLEALDHRDARLRGEAARSLGVLRDGRTTPRLNEVLHTDPDPTVRQSALDALGMIGGRRAIRALTDVLKNELEDPAIRAKAAEGLGTCNAQNAVPDLIAALEDRQPEVRFWSAFALGILQSGAALPRLERLAIEDRASIPEWGSVASAAREATDMIHLDSPQKAARPQ